MYHKNRKHYAGDTKSGANGDNHMYLQVWMLRYDRYCPLLFTIHCHTVTHKSNKKSYQLEVFNFRATAHVPNTYTAQ